MQQDAAPSWLDLYDYRMRVAAIYRERNRALLQGADEESTLRRFRAARDRLFAEHPQSALNAEQRKTFAGLSYFPYNPLFRVEAVLTPEPESDRIIQTADGPHILPMRPAASAEFSLDGAPQRLVVYWLDVYGGGLFLPFKDPTSPGECYGGGRYLFDTVKGSDFVRLDEPQDDARSGYKGGRIVLDFNYAYNPSCAYDSRWVCPLAPHENRLPVPVRAGEKNYLSTIRSKRD